MCFYHGHRNHKTINSDEVNKAWPRKHSTLLQVGFQSRATAGLTQDPLRKASTFYLKPLTPNRRQANITPSQKVTVRREETKLWGAFLPQEDLYPRKEKVNSLFLLPAHPRRVGDSPQKSLCRQSSPVTQPRSSDPGERRKSDLFLKTAMGNGDGRVCFKQCLLSLFLQFMYWGK